MSRYSVEITHSIVTYYKTIGDDEQPIRSKIITPLDGLHRFVNFDDFVEENRWIDADISDILSSFWQKFPFKNVYLSKSIANATLDIKLSNSGWPKTIYRTVYTHHRNFDLAPITPEQRELLDKKRAIVSSVRDELSKIRDSNLMYEYGFRRCNYNLNSISSAIGVAIRKFPTEALKDIHNIGYRMSEKLDEIDDVKRYIIADLYDISKMDNAFANLNKFVDDLFQNEIIDQEFYKDTLSTINLLHEYVIRHIDLRADQNIDINRK